GRGVRLGGVVGGGGQCLAAQEQQAGQQRDEDLHEGVTHLLCAIMTQACPQAHRRRRVSGSCSNIGDIGQLRASLIRPKTCMAFLALGINHKTASVDIRERVAFTPEQMVEALQQLCSRTPSSEAAILSTCNRSELYL